MRPTTLLPTLALSAVLAVSCEMLTGKEIARLSVDAVSTSDQPIIKETTLDLKKGEELAIWSHMDLEYDEPLTMRFLVQMSHDTINNEFEFDPFEKNVTVGEMRTSMGAHTNWSFTGKNGGIRIHNDGHYTIKVQLVASENSSLVLRKAELILKK